LISASFYQHPSHTLDLIGVTGTNGKTSVSYMVAAILRAAGGSTGVIGTVGVQVNGQPFPAQWTVSTTPESLDLQQFFSQMRDENIEHVVMEVTSIAIDQERTTACEFDTAIFTNLTQDHLDYHGSMDAYQAAKRRLFTEYPLHSSKPFAAVVNADDPAGEEFGAAAAGLGYRVCRYGTAGSADLRAEGIITRPNGSDFTVVEASGVSYPVSIPIGGLFSISNALAAIGAARVRGVAVADVQMGLRTMPPIPGRFEPVPSAGLGFDVIVDYAHTPDGLENVLRSALTLKPARLIAVFGCGGDRDRGKRPRMGRIAAELADLVVVTSDNPRMEDPESIVQEILDGIDPVDLATKVRAITDRREAIRTALCTEARTGDLVVIAGKGHETYQLIGGETFPFDDRLVAAEALAECS
jgi:UDP-N-acetylmuramyl-tripeptide synthetase